MKHYCAVKVKCVAFAVRSSDVPTVRPSDVPTVRPSDVPTVRPSDVRNVKSLSLLHRWAVRTNLVLVDRRGGRMVRFPKTCHIHRKFVLMSSVTCNM